MKKLLFLAAVATLLFSASAAPSADMDSQFQFLNGTWRVSVHWISPEIIGDFDMTVTMSDLRHGTVSAEGSTGDLRRLGRNIRWDFNNFAYYKGTLSSLTSMSGTMQNVDGNTGTWTAVQIGASPELRADSKVILGK